MQSQIDQINAKIDQLKAKRKQIGVKRPSGAKEFSESAILLGELLSAERDLAKLLNKPFAVPLDWPLKWTGEEPLVFFKNLHLYLSYPINVKTSRANSLEQIPSDRIPFAFVTFSCVRGVRITDANEEVFEFGAYFGKGLSPVGAHIIEDSDWIKQIVKINHGHDCFEASEWTGLKHYHLQFHDLTLECAAKNVQWLVTQEPARNLNESCFK